jgi:hypothetical protein
MNHWYPAEGSSWDLTLHRNSIEVASNYVSITVSGLETCHSDLVRYLIVVCWCDYSWSFHRILISCHVLSFNLSIIYHTSHIYICGTYYVPYISDIISYHIINSALYIIIVSHHLLYHIVPGHFPTSYRFHTQWLFMESAVIPRRSYVLCCSQTGPFSTSWFKLDTARIFCFFGYFVADLANWARKRSQKDPVWKSTSPIANGYPWILCVTCTAFPGAKTTQKLGPHHELRSVVRS